MMAMDLHTAYRSDTACSCSICRRSCVSFSNRILSYVTAWVSWACIGHDSCKLPPRTMVSCGCVSVGTSGMLGKASAIGALSKAVITHTDRSIAYVVSFCAQGMETVSYAPDTPLRARMDLSSPPSCICSLAR